MKWEEKEMAPKKKKKKKNGKQRQETNPESTVSSRHREETEKAENCVSGCVEHK